MKLKIDILINFGNSFNDSDSLIKNSLVSDSKIPKSWINVMTILKR